MIVEMVGTACKWFISPLVKLWGRWGRPVPQPLHRVQSQVGTLALLNRLQEKERIGLAAFDKQFSFPKLRTINTLSGEQK
jgi:hypothetical protein